MDSDISRKDFEVTGVSRSGRVRKKSSKLMDFESPDDIDARPRKIVTTPVVRHRSYTHEPEPKPEPETEPEPDPESDLDIKSEPEEMEGGSSDSDYYDPSMDNRDSMDSMDSDDAGLSDSDVNVNSPGEHGSKNSRPGNSLYFSERSKRKPIFSDVKDIKSKVQRGDGLSPRSSSRNRTSSVKNSNNNSYPQLTNGSSELGQNGGSEMYVEVAAHLRLLGESLAIIGERLKEHEGQIAVSGSLSVLLDTLLCSLVPLVCLTTQVPEIAPPLPLLRNTLDDIAYIMPGL